jgi:hypothetical protein
MMREAEDSLAAATLALMNDDDEQREGGADSNVSL